MDDEFEISEFDFVKSIDESDYERAFKNPREHELKLKRLHFLKCLCRNIVEDHLSKKFNEK